MKECYCDSRSVSFGLRKTMQQTQYNAHGECRAIIRQLLHLRWKMGWGCVRMVEAWVRVSLGTVLPKSKLTCLLVQTCLVHTKQASQVRAAQRTKQVKLGCLTCLTCLVYLVKLTIIDCIADLAMLF
jgi:hypothetical protein